MFKDNRIFTAQLFSDEGGPLFINRPEASGIDIYPSRDLAVLNLAA